MVRQIKQVENKHLTKILKKMFTYVKEKYTPEYVKQPEWFCKHTWTIKQQNKFTDWMVDYLYNNAEARREIMSFPRKNKKDIKEVVDWFLFGHGWKNE